MRNRLPATIVSPGRFFSDERMECTPVRKDALSREIKNRSRNGKPKVPEDYQEPVPVRPAAGRGKINQGTGNPLSLEGGGDSDFHRRLMLLVARIHLDVRRSAHKYRNLTPGICIVYFTFSDKIFRFVTKPQKETRAPRGRRPRDYGLRELNGTDGNFGPVPAERKRASGSPGNRKKL